MTVKLMVIACMENEGVNVGDLWCERMHY